ncbi:TPA: gluconate 5-dehydrogenase [Yersinia enterocolitica]|nr:gluconate 5-dehydrogenase [Yersinia enterocolitica]MBX9488164.1 gluconate 5-dehydrogenase [Yersinia enterocolitica]MBX9493550.1 gluconate 5-dehydrogenase [Yersinia enterocolitica]HDL8053727.1 gluconate 5-dehydrogenase [Yersinia enterocolitica]HDM8436943.1 gluconate 5-dehydrogenase [Yersinia enterocolitica]
MTASLRSACFRRCGHFVNNLLYLLKILTLLE